MSNDINNGNMKVVFKTAFSGYRREDVNAYIQNENRKFMSLEQSYRDTIDKLQWELEAAKEEINRMSHAIDNYISENAELTIKLDSCEKNTVSSSAMLKEKDSEILSLSASLEESNRIISELNEKLELSKTAADDSASDVSVLMDKLTLADAKNEELEREIALLKGELKNASENVTSTDKAAVDDLLYRAKNATEDMLKRAEAGAGVILDKARREALDYRMEIFSAAKEIFTSATEELRRSIGICMSDFVSGIRTAKNNTERAAEEAGRCDDELGRRIERMQNDLDRAIAEKLAEFDKKHGDGR